MGFFSSILWCLLVPLLLLLLLLCLASRVRDLFPFWDGGVPTPGGYLFYHIWKTLRLRMCLCSWVCKYGLFWPSLWPKSPLNGMNSRIWILTGSIEVQRMKFSYTTMFELYIHILSIPLPERFSTFSKVWIYPGDRPWTDIKILISTLRPRWD